MPHQPVEMCMWGDGRFRALSRPGPSAQWLWVYLLTGPHNTPLPGIFSLGERALAEALGWGIRALRCKVAELEGAKILASDWSAPLLWLPNALKYRLPKNPNGLKSWRTLWAKLPECHLKERCLKALRQAVFDSRPILIPSFRALFPEPFAEPFSEPFAVPSSRPPCRNRKQEQEQVTGTTPLPPKGGKAAELPPALDTPEFRAAWSAWEKYRAETRHKLTPTTVERQLKKLAALGPAAAAASIDQSITHGWRGLFPPEPSRNGHGKAGETMAEKIARVRREDECRKQSGTAGPPGTASSLR